MVYLVKIVGLNSLDEFNGPRGLNVAVGAKASGSQRRPRPGLSAAD